MAHLEPDILEYEVKWALKSITMNKASGGDRMPAELLQILKEDAIKVQFGSIAQSCPTLCDPMNCSKPGFPVLYYLPKFTQTNVHRVSDVIQPSHSLWLPFHLALDLFQHQEKSLLFTSR